MGKVNVNGWEDIDPQVAVLVAGSNHDVTSAEYLLLVPGSGGSTVTGFVPPSTDYTWKMDVANAGPDNVVFSHNTGSTVGQRTMQLPGRTIYTLTTGQTVTMFFVPSSLSPAPGWYTKEAGISS